MNEGRHARDERPRRRGVQLNRNSHIPRDRVGLNQKRFNNQPGPSSGAAHLQTNRIFPGAAQKATAAKSISADRAISGAGRPAAAQEGASGTREE